jgi:predicted PurR-regulated permease PerM
MKNKKGKTLLAGLTKGIKKLKVKADKAKKSRQVKRVTHLPKSKQAKNNLVIEISSLSVMKSILVIIGVLVSVYLLYAIGNILILFFLAFFIASALDPLIDWMQMYKIPRALGLLLVYFVVFMLIALLFVLLVPIIAEQLIGLVGMVNNFILSVSQSPTLDIPFGDQIKPYIEELYKAIDFKVVAEQLKDSLQLISSQLLSLGGNLWSILSDLSNGLFNFIILLILVFFMTVDEQSIENFTISIFPRKYSEYVSERLQMIKMKIGEWIRGQLIVSLVAAVITYIGLALAGVEYSLLISLIAGICMIVPVFGRVIAAVISIPIVLNQSPALALFLIIYYFAISQFENNIIVPLLMNKAVGLSPIVIIFALMVGFQFMNVLGLILAIPIATIIAIFAKDVGRKIHSKERAKR